MGNSYLSLPGSAGNTASTIDAGPLDIVADIDLRVDCALVDWTPPTLEQALISKWTASGDQRSFQLAVSETDLKFYLTTAGTNGTTVTYTATNWSSDRPADGDRIFLRFALDADDGASGSDGFFYHSQGGLIWTQIGTTIHKGFTTSIHSGSADVVVGATNAGTAVLAEGRFHKAQIYDGIEGTLVFDADFTSVPGGKTFFIEDSVNAATVTINQSGDPQAEIIQAGVHARYIKKLFSQFPRRSQTEMRQAFDSVRDDVDSLAASIDAIAAKLNTDATVNDTNYLGTSLERRLR